MKKRILHTLLAGLLLSLHACQTEEDANPASIPDETESLCDFVLNTRAGTGTDYQNTTYRAQLFYRGQVVTQQGFPRLDSLYTPYTGTYCDPKGTNTWLTPCSVDATNYAYTGEGSQYGLRAGRYHDYYLFVSSPATVYVKYGEVMKTNPAYTSQQVKMEYYGLPYLRGGEAKDHPAVSAAAKVTTTGLNLQSTYLYNLDDTMQLVEYRSRAAFSVRCGDAISHANLKKLELKGMRRYAVFRPFTKDFFFEEDAANYEDVVVYESPAAQGIRLDRGGTEGAYTDGESQSLTGATTATHLDDTKTNTYFTYFLSDDYKSLNTSNQYINTPANLCLTLVSDTGNPISVDPLPLPVDFDPQKSYFFMITINSVYLSIDVTVRNWDTPFTIDETVEDVEPLNLTIQIADWTSHSNAGQVDPSSGGGGDTPANEGTSGITTGNWNTPSGGTGVVE